MADASDSKSDVGDYMWVQVPPPAPSRGHTQSVCPFCFNIGTWIWRKLRKQFVRRTKQSSELFVGYGRNSAEVPPPAPRPRSFERGFLLHFSIVSCVAIIPPHSIAHSPDALTASHSQQHSRTSKYQYYQTKRLSRAVRAFVLWNIWWIYRLINFKSGSKCL